MPFKRVLVECAVLALQDSCVFYPNCKVCFSRINTDTEDTRLTCSKCGYCCTRSLLDYRYRLSMRVARGSCMFGVTVFGNCLNQFFGTDASGLQRLVADNAHGALLQSSKSALLLKAVEECFIGKHFIFGIKVTENDIEPWVENTKDNSHMAQIIATQMILPKAPVLRGCTVLDYFEAALQKAAKSKKNTFGLYEKEKGKGEQLLPSPPSSQTPAFTNDTLHSSGFLPRSLLSSQHLDGSLSPTPPWQQTLGLITSSAEQEESGKDDNQSPCLSKKCRRMTTQLKSWLGPPTRVHKTTGLLTLQANNSSMSESILSNCPVQEEFPLSESLTEFLKDKNKLNNSQQNEMFLESIHDNIDFMDKSQVCTGYTAAIQEPSDASREEESESSVYNCSADLFSNSPRMDISIAEFALLSENKSDQKQVKYKIRESLGFIANFDFIPPSQSTPAAKVTVQKGMSLRSDFQIRDTGESSKENINCTNQTTPHCVTPRSRNSKPHKLQYGLTTKKHFSSRRGELTSTVCKRRSSGFADKDNALIVPPTPAHLHRTSLFKYCKEQTLNVSSKKENFQLQTHSKSDCKPPGRGLAVDESECSNANEECDWSRDLFSDSV